MNNLLSLFICSFLLLSVNSLVGQKRNKKGNESAASQITVNESCTYSETSEKIKEQMAPFKLDKITKTKIHYKAYTQVQELSIPIYHSTKYKFVINGESLPTEVKMKLTDKPHKLSTAKVLSQSSSKTFEYEVPEDFEGSRIYLTIKIPGDPEYNKHVRNRGCVLVGSGYEDVDF